MGIYDSTSDSFRSNNLIKAGEIATSAVTIPKASFYHLLEPDNSEDPVTVSLATGYAEGTIVLVKDVHGATAENITITPLGSFVDNEGTAVDQVVIDTDDGYAALLLLSGLTTLLASNGVDLVT